MEPHGIQQISFNEPDPTKISFKLFRKVMKANHIECEDKAI